MPANLPHKHTGARAKSLEVLRFVDQYTAEHPWCPDLRDIGSACGISSTSVVIYYLVPLIDAGLLGGYVLESGNLAPRTIHVTDLGREFLRSQEFKKPSKKKGGSNV